MIQDLKADSARWEQERRAASRNGGGTQHLIQSNSSCVRRSNSPLGASRGDTARGPSDYNSWKNRQDRTAQDYETSYPNPMAMDIDYPAPGPVKLPSGYPAAQYPGVAAPSYAPSSAYSPQPIAPVQAGYAAPGYGYPNPPAQYSPQTGAGGYPGMAVPPPAFGQESMYSHGSNYQTAPPGYVTSGGPTRSLGVSAAATSRSIYAPTLPAPVYADTTDPYGGGYAPAATSSNDPFLGRGAYNITTNPTPASSDDLGSPAGTTQPRTGYGGIPDQYDESSGIQAPTTSTSSTPAQLATSGPSGSRRDRESEPREQRDRGDRGEHRDHRSRQDRDGRHRHGGHR